MRRCRQVTQKETNSFKKIVYDHYKIYARKLPWRKKSVNPYHIFIAEVMLQQTQVERVAEKYKGFIKAFHNFDQLARAPFVQVLKQWKGLGYNRRALHLHRSAKQIMRDFEGSLPRDPVLLRSLPGIGFATAASICVYAFNMPLVFIETNIRTVFIHHFFAHKKEVTDDEVMPLVSQTLDTENAYAWYSALMDYGVFLKKEYKNPARESKHYAKQSRFEGSDRQIRGLIIGLLTSSKSLTIADMYRSLRTPKKRIEKIVNTLLKDGLLCHVGTQYCITQR